MAKVNLPDAHPARERLTDALLQLCRVQDELKLARIEFRNAQKAFLRASREGDPDQLAHSLS